MVAEQKRVVLLTGASAGIATICRAGAPALPMGLPTSSGFLSSRLGWGIRSGSPPPNQPPPPPPPG
jgi:hypothetical protein